MKIIRYIGVITVISFGPLSSEAQMNNLSQYHLTPVYTSPAESGMSDYFQVLMHYRKQSLAGDQGYENVSVSGTYPLRYKDGRRFGGLALGISSESSGMLGIFKEQNVKAGYAYNWQASSMHHVSIGLHGGYYRTSLALGNITTDAQYQDGAYNPGHELGETFSGDVSQAFRIDAGATWYGTDASGNRMFSLGFAAFNVNGTGYKFMSSDKGERLPVRYQAYGSLKAYTHDRLEIVPTFRYMREKNYDQLNVGSLFLYQLQTEGNTAESHLGIGIWYSLNNAAIVSLQWMQPSYILSLSYDVSASSDIQQGQVNNGVEFTLGWRMNKFRPE